MNSGNIKNLASNTTLFEGLQNFLILCYFIDLDKNVTRIYETRMKLPTKLGLN